MVASNLIIFGVAILVSTDLLTPKFPECFNPHKKVKHLRSQQLSQLMRGVIHALFKGLTYPRYMSRIA